MGEETMTLCPCGQARSLDHICGNTLESNKAVCDDTPGGLQSAVGHGERGSQTQAGTSASCGTSGCRREDIPGRNDVHGHASDNVLGNSEEHCRCHDHGHTLPEDVDWRGLDRPSSTRAIYRIANMDCPVEEALIRKKLAGVQGIKSLEFNLMQRVLVVNHALADTECIESALKAIDMTPEPLIDQGALAVFSINGMDCPEEERLIRSKLAKIAGVYGLDFNLMQRTLKVRHEPAALPAIAAALDSLHMGATLLDADGKHGETVTGSKIPWKRLAAAGGFAAFSEILELIHQWDVQPLAINVNSWRVFNYPLLEALSLVFALIAIALAGLATYKKGWLAVSNFNLNINALMAVAVTGAVLIGQFPEAAMVMALFNLSEAIEAKALDKARNAIKGLLALSPEQATILQPDGSWRDVNIHAVAVGSRARVKPGEKIALDGTVLTGGSLVNQAPITGESMPVEKAPGDPVYAGTINESGSFEFEVTAVANDSTLARIIHAVESAQGSRAPIQRFVDAFARYYTPAIFLASILAALLPPLFFHSSWLSSIYTGLVILVIGCPCALVISTPVSIVSGMAAATRYGILIKGGIFLEQGRLLQCIALDKTGTITAGKPVQTDFVLVGDGDVARIQSIAASLAVRSDHPVSRAIARAAAEARRPTLHVSEFAAIAGCGVTGIIDGQKWYLGNERLMRDIGSASEDMFRRISRLEREGKTAVALANASGVVAVIAAADRVRETSVAAIRHLKSMGVRTVMLTGDNAHTAAAIASEVGVDEFRANLLPQDKLMFIEGMENSGKKVGMVGDGINDAPALARANIGFAMAREGTDTAIETADVALMDDDLRKIPRFITLSRGTYAILTQNITLALGVKALFFVLALTGNATMWMAVFADVGTALLVVANGLRAMRQ